MASLASVTAAIAWVAEALIGNDEAPLDKLPYEILDDIFRLASTDGGPTACALSLVSHTVRNAARTSRFTSVSLVSGLAAQLRCFLAALAAARAEAARERAEMPRVRHLCLHFTPCAGPQSWGITPTLAGAYGALADATLRRSLPAAEYSAQVDATWREYFDVLRALCGAVLADVETLCVLRHSCYGHDGFERPELLLECPGGLPKLRELSFNGGPLLPMVPTPREEGGPVPLLYPGLRRLNINVDREHARVLELEEWAEEAPHLVWFRLGFDIGMVSLHPQVPFMPSFLATFAPHIFDAVADEFEGVGQRAGVDGGQLAVQTDRDGVFPDLQRLLLMARTPSPRYLERQEFIEYALFAATLGRLFRILDTPIVFSSSYANEDVDPKHWEYDIKNVSEGDLMRQDWRLRAGGLQGVFLPDFWDRRWEDSAADVGVLRRLWRAIVGA
ncbi:hypothetical protein C2E23DRAFT_880524 [Lenzites betulinus]|nr:hypothetical protein C2E23DRAFT_880524 [Lenzites betulinus]